jgi:hypothetical protein
MKVSRLVDASSSAIGISAIEKLRIPFYIREEVEDLLGEQGANKKARQRNKYLLLLSRPRSLVVFFLAIPIGPVDRSRRRQR